MYKNQYINESHDYVTFTSKTGSKNTSNETKISPFKIKAQNMSLIILILKKYVEPQNSKDNPSKQDC